MCVLFFHSFLNEMKKINYRKVPKFWDARSTLNSNKEAKPKGYFVGIANSEDPEEQSDLGMHCLLRPIYPKI